MDPTKPLAVIADIHGNALALRAVLDDIAAQGIAQVVNLGDVFSGPLDPAGVWTILRDRDIPTVRGNHDRYLVTQLPAEMWATDRLTHALLPAAACDWIRELPAVIATDGIFACHATPDDDNTYWTERVSDGGVQMAPLATITARAAGIDAGLILCAHTHLPRVVTLPDGRMLVNPGSVGCPAYADDAPAPHVVQTGTPMASYAIVAGGPGAWAVTHRAVRYDWAAAAAQAQAHGRADWARAVATGWWE